MAEKIIIIPPPEETPLNIGEFECRVHNIRSYGITPIIAVEKGTAEDLLHAMPVIEKLKVPIVVGNFSEIALLSNLGVPDDLALHLSPVGVAAAKAGETLRDLTFTLENRPPFREITNAELEEDPDYVKYTPRVKDVKRDKNQQNKFRQRYHGR